MQLPPPQIGRHELYLLAQEDFQIMMQSQHRIHTVSAPGFGTFHLLLHEQQHQFGVHDDDAPVYGLPQEDATNPERWFYAEMIEIVNDYHEQLQRVVQRAYEAGQVSEEQWVREKWTNRMALDRKLRIAGDMSGYKILTNNSLLIIRDPETWQRIFEPTTAYAHLGTITSISQQRAPSSMNTLMWLMYKFGRGLRFMLAVPDDPDLKTYSSRHPPAPDRVTY
ncbi:hypothetical protein E8E11_005071 [Didymella keratinophila]|nr:hypothetical protein E8E11_005071 [Didymella keratinophila]